MSSPPDETHWEIEEIHFKTIPTDMPAINPLPTNDDEAFTLLGELIVILRERIRKTFP